MEWHSQPDNDKPHVRVILAHRLHLCSRQTEGHFDHHYRSCRSELVVKSLCPCCSALVLCTCALRLTIQQSTACLLCAVASGCMLRRWWRLDDYDRSRIWKHYGWFCGLMCFGSCAGTVAYAAISSFFDNYYKSFTDGDYTSDNYSVYSRVSFVLQTPYNWRQCCRFHRNLICHRHCHVIPFQGLRSLVVYFLAYPFTFGCLVSAKLLVLDRLNLLRK